MGTPLAERWWGSAPKCCGQGIVTRRAGTARAGLVELQRGRARIAGRRLAQPRCVAEEGESESSAEFPANATSQQAL